MKGENQEPENERKYECPTQHFEAIEGRLRWFGHLSRMRRKDTEVECQGPEEKEEAYVQWLNDV